MLDPKKHRKTSSPAGDPESQIYWDRIALADNAEARRLERIANQKYFDLPDRYRPENPDIHKLLRDLQYPKIQEDALNALTAMLPPFHDWLRHTLLHSGPQEIMRCKRSTLEKTFDEMTKANNCWLLERNIGPDPDPDPGKDDGGRAAGTQLRPNLKDDPDPKEDPDEPNSPKI